MGIGYEGADQRPNSRNQRRKSEFVSDEKRGRGVLTRVDKRREKTETKERMVKTALALITGDVRRSARSGSQNIFSEAEKFVINLVKNGYIPSLVAASRVIIQKN